MIIVQQFLRRLVGRPALHDMRSLYMYDHKSQLYVTEDVDTIPDGATVWEYRAVKGPSVKHVAHSID